MTAIPLLSGITASERADFKVSYPVNLEPVPTESGLSNGYLRSAMGATLLGEGPGIDRGGVIWSNLHHRVMGSKLVTVSSGGTVTELADVGDDGQPVTLDYGFDRLAIRSGANLYYWDGAALVQVTDPDLGPCVDVAWFNGQYFSTDGTYIVALQLSDPTAVDPLKYGAAESDPDMVTGMLKLRNELAVLGENTIEFFTYAGGSGFPLQVSSGATIPIGCVGPRAKCLYSQTFAFVGAGRGNAPGVWLAGSGTALKLSTRAIDDYLAAEPDLSGIVLEARVSRDEQRLLVHLSDRTLVYLFEASQASKQPVWYECRSGLGMDSAYRLRNAVLCEGRFIVGDTESAKLGVLSEATAEHFGDPVGWEFRTRFIYNAAKGGIIHDLDLMGLPGRGEGQASAHVSFTEDGETYTIERTCKLPAPHNRTKRVRWSPHKHFSKYIGLRFRGDSNHLAGWAALEAEIEALK